MYKNNFRCVDMKPENHMNMNTNMNMEMEPPMQLPGMQCEPIYECPCEKVCHREINHHIQHIQPVNTKIINHHIYHHSYMPCYTCCEENEVCNVYDCNPHCK